MTIKEMREKLEMTQDSFSRTYNIPKRTIQNWESGKRTPPPYVLEMLENAIKHYKPRTMEEVMSMPLTVSELKDNCDFLIQKGYGNCSVLLSNDTMETGYHGMYYGLSPMDDNDDYVTLN